MMRKHIIYFLVIISLVFVACTKSEETKDLWQAVIIPASPISESAPLSGAIKGTMLAGKTYTVSGDIFVNAGDTLVIQPGVTVNFTGTGGVPVGLGVKGTLLSLGTKDAPIFLTFPGVTRTDQLGSDPTKDPALSGKWTGVIGATTCPLMVIKWTHVDFGGAAISSAMKSFTGGSSPYPLYFANPDGSFV